MSQLSVSLAVSGGCLSDNLPSIWGKKLQKSFTFMCFVLFVCLLFIFLLNLIMFYNICPGGMDESLGTNEF